VPIQDISSLPLHLTEFVTRLEEHVEEVVPMKRYVPPFDQAKLKYLSERLGRGIPIGSYSEAQIRFGNLPAEQALVDIKDELAKQEPDNERITAALEVARSRIQETPCTVAEILNSGWLYKSERIYGKALRIMETFSEDDEWEFSENIFSLDAMLRTSIETSYLGSLFIDAFDAQDPEEEISS
jgi:hypothetical protein